MSRTVPRVTTKVATVPKIKKGGSRGRPLSFAPVFDFHRNSTSIVLGAPVVQYTFGHILGTALTRLHPFGAKYIGVLPRMDRGAGGGGY